MDIIRLAAESCLNIHISGEKGTGKETIFRLLYNQLQLTENPFIKIDCSIVEKSTPYIDCLHPDKRKTQSESVKNHFPVLFQNAVLFFHGIDKMYPALQSTIADFLWEKRPGKKGEAVSWIFSSSTHPLTQYVYEGKLNAKLSDALGSISIHIPPLRSAPEKIPKLIYYFLNRYADQFGRGVIVKPPQGAIKKLTNYKWPNNIRELQQMVKMALVSGSWSKTIDQALNGEGLGEYLPSADHSNDIFFLLPDMKMTQGKFLKHSEAKNTGLMDLVIHDEIMKQQFSQ